MLVTGFVNSLHSAQQNKNRPSDETFTFFANSFIPFFSPSFSFAAFFPSIHSVSFRVPLFVCGDRNNDGGGWLHHFGFLVCPFAFDYVSKMLNWMLVLDWRGGEEDCVKRVVRVHHSFVRLFCQLPAILRNIFPHRSPRSKTKPMYAQVHRLTPNSDMAVLSALN